MGIPLRETRQLTYLSRIKKIRHDVHHIVMHIMKGKIGLFLFFRLIFYQVSLTVY